MMDTFPFFLDDVEATLEQISANEESIPFWTGIAENMKDEAYAMTYVKDVIERKYPIRSSTDELSGFVVSKAVKAELQNCVEMLVPDISVYKLHSQKIKAIKLLLEASRTYGAAINLRDSKDIIDTIW